MLIGLTGKARSGKDTVCEFIKEWGRENKRVVRRDGFADRLKLSAYRVFHPEGTVEQALVWCNDLKAEGNTVEVRFSGLGGDTISGRKFLQSYGTEAHRDVFGTEFWVDACLPSDYLVKPTEVLVITDVRFPNEADRVHDLGGEVWSVLRGTGDQIHESGHSSEKPLPMNQIDQVVLNNSSLQGLRDHILSLMERKVYV